MNKRLTTAAETVLERRYYLRNAEGELIEDWHDLVCRVVGHVGQNEEPAMVDKFFNMIYELDFLPNSPCLMNAGTELGQLSACFVLPVEDSMEGIFSAVKNGALVHKTGGGTGYSFSRLRPRNSAVQSTQGVASGPLSFMQVFDAATETIKQGGKRRGANMGVLRVDHPDILDFIDAKEDTTKFTNFNFSVAVTDAFMDAVKVHTDYDLIDPSTGEVVASLPAREVFDRIAERAWKTGEPGVLFIDTANKANPTPMLGDYEASNPCGELFLLPYESCNLGSINLGNFVIDRGAGRKLVDKERLREVVTTAVRFLDNVIDCNRFPIPEIKEATLATRKIGLGIMGLHDMLIQLEVPYDSTEGREIAHKTMEWIREAALNASQALAEERGAYLACEANQFFSRRNATLTSIQPTGTVSMIADCASGCEPYFSLVMVKNVMDGDRLLMVNKHFERVARAEGFYSDALMERVAAKGTVVGDPDVPARWQQIFKCAQDISPANHVAMQATLQLNVDSGISKTINLPADATVETVRQAYLTAHQLGCKGITVYRDGSRDGQVLNAGVDKPEEQGGLSGPAKRKLPDVLDAKRYCIKGAEGESMYLIICFDENEQPMEVFAKFPFDNRADLRDRATMWTVTCRLVSLALRSGISMEDVIKQLDRSSGHMHDLPAQLAKLLKSFLANTNHGFAPPCPDCGEPMVYEEGCENCHSCGYSKCS